MTVVNNKNDGEGISLLNLGKITKKRDGVKAYG